jgi:hypothetical protein
LTYIGESDHRQRRRPGRAGLQPRRNELL